MDKQKARAFLKAIAAVEKEYGFCLAAGYEENIDYDYEDSPYVSGITSHLVVIDEKGNEQTVEDLQNYLSNCLYCGRTIHGDESFCHLECKEKYHKNN